MSDEWQTEEHLTRHSVMSILSDDRRKSSKFHRKIVDTRHSKQQSQTTLTTQTHTCICICIHMNMHVYMHMQHTDAFRQERRLLLVCGWRKVMRAEDIHLVHCSTNDYMCWLEKKDRGQKFRGGNGRGQKSKGEKVMSQKRSMVQTPGSKGDTVGLD